MLVTNLDSQQVDDVAKWFAAVKPWYLPIPGDAGRRPWAILPARSARRPATPAPAHGRHGNGPSGPGLIVQIYGRHYHNADDEVGREQYVRNTLIKALASEKMHAMGVSYPVLIDPEAIGQEEIVIPGPKRRDNDARCGGGQPPAA